MYIFSRDYCRFSAATRTILARARAPTNGIPDCPLGLKLHVLSPLHMRVHPRASKTQFRRKSGRRENYFPAVLLIAAVCLENSCGKRKKRRKK